jgi:hypothetical protein
VAEGQPFKAGRMWAIPSDDADLEVPAIGILHTAKEVC